MEEERYNELIKEIKEIKEREILLEKEFKLIRKDWKKNNKRYEQLIIGVKLSMDEKFRTIKSEFDGRMYEIMLVLQNEMKEMKFAIETMLGKIEK